MDDLEHGRAFVAESGGEHVDVRRQVARGDRAARLSTPSESTPTVMPTPETFSDDRAGSAPCTLSPSETTEPAVVVTEPAARGCFRAFRTRTRNC